MENAGTTLQLSRTKYALLIVKVKIKRSFAISLLYTTADSPSYRMKRRSTKRLRLSRGEKYSLKRLKVDGSLLNRLFSLAHNSGHDRSDFASKVLLISWMTGSLIDLAPVFFEPITCKSGLTLAILIDLLYPPQEPRIASLTAGVNLFSVLSRW